jgi:hypothetical protein
MDIQLINTDATIHNESIAKIWIQNNWEIVLTDLQKIMGNKYLVLETLLRIIDNIN